MVLILRFLCFYLSWQQDLVTQRINPGICSHRHWDLAESTHGHLCTAATEAQGSLLLYPSSSGAKMDQPLVDPSQRKKDFSGKHTLNLFRKHLCGCCKGPYCSHCFFQTTLSLHLICQCTLTWSGAC